MSVEARSLAAKSCTPCRGGVPPFTTQEVAAHQSQTPEWSVQDDARRIERTFRFKSFATAFVFVEQVARLAEAEGHHPDISFGWGLRDEIVSADYRVRFRPGQWLRRGLVRMR